MASPCEVLVDTDDREKKRSESPPSDCETGSRSNRIKFSRFRTNNIIYQINHSNGRSISVDQETGLLLDYAATCYKISNGMFDITTGFLRRLWKFDGTDRVPSKTAVRAAWRHVGWWRAKWENGMLLLPAGMEIDLGGIGKEYAVDRAAALSEHKPKVRFLLTLVGICSASGLRRDNRTWAIGIDDPQRTGKAVLYRLDISRGAIATSGDARRYLIWRGNRLGHILNPRTGWPVKNAPRSVTVLCTTCVEAGTLSTLAYLQGSQARGFLEQQGVQFWIL